MSKELDIIEENKKYYEQELANMDYKWFGIKRNKTKDEQIADLEAKLAESEADKKALICDYESRITKEQELMSWLEHNNEELKQQLAEKDEEIEELKHFKVTIGTMETNQVDISSTTYVNQDKISFAVAELEKAKIEFETYYADNIWNYPQYLEDRIAELTHQHEYKGE